MKSFTFAALIAAVSAIRLQEPWKESTLPDCPDFSRSVLDDGQTHVVRYPHVGATCKGPPVPEPKGTKEAQAAPALVQLSEDPPAEATKPAAKDVPPKQAAPAPWVGLEHCPNMDERFTLVDGRTRAIPWPAAGFNCHNEGQVTAQKP